MALGRSTHAAQHQTTRGASAKVLSARVHHTHLHSLGDAKFVSLTTFRRSGERVSTPVWVARDGDALVVTTPEGSGKVKRLRHNPRVEMVPCSRRGRVDEDVEPVAGVVQIRSEPQDGIA